MAYHETNITKLIKLINNPAKYTGKIFPFLKSKLFPYRRDIYEFLGFDKYSKPYPGHEDLLKTITKSDGFFVQCGGNDGYFQDPTYYLEKFLGWKGIIVEPLPIGELCKRNRKKSQIMRCACVSFDYTETNVSFIDCNAMSFVKDSIENGNEWISEGERVQNITHREIIVPARTIQSVIEENSRKFNSKKIDLFVADVEGYELQILKGLDFTKNSPRYILIEAQTSSRFVEISDYLKKLGYYLVSNIVDKDYLFANKDK